MIADETKKRVVCPLCGADDARRVFLNREVRVVRCRRCRFLYQNPRDHRSLEEEAENAESYYEIYNAVREAQIKVFAHRFDRFLKGRPAGKALDVGCGLGVFLEVCRDRGWEAVGVDLSAWACRRVVAQGLAVIPGTVESARFADGAFDVVHMNHVLEHIPEPLAFLNEIRRILKSDGRLLIEVPNERYLRLRYGLMNSLRGAGTEPVGPHRSHLNLFTRRTLHRLLERANFRVLALAEEGLAGPGRVESSVRTNTLGVRLAVMAARWRMDERLGLAMYLVAVAAKSDKDDSRPAPPHAS